MKFNFKFLSSDENECATGNNNCEQLCRDTEGSYYCECHKGYKVDADRITCQGKMKPLHSRATYVYKQASVAIVVSNKGYCLFIYCNELLTLSCATAISVLLD